MTIATVFRFLVGRRSAIQQIANTPHAVWLGGLFVVSAGLAREYDAKDLLAEPWYLLVPLAASFITSLILFTLVYFTGRFKGGTSRFWPTYSPFLALYWMTAPLAWLYAIPVDRFLSADDATLANLSLLATVSLWRVSLMTVVVRNYLGAPLWSAIWLVMFFADSVAMLVLYFTPLPIFNIMGGIEKSKSDQLIESAAFVVGCLGIPSWFVWAIGLFFIFESRSSWQPMTPTPDHGRVNPGLWALAIGMILVWALILPVTQPEQQRRRAVERALVENRLGDAVRLMSSLTPQDFPPHWDPPPWLVYRDPTPDLLDIVEATLGDDAAPWVRSIYVTKLQSRVNNIFFAVQWDILSAVERDRYLRSFERVPNQLLSGDRLSIMAERKRIPIVKCG